MDSLTVITSKKYKTLGALLNAPFRSIIGASNNEKNENIKSYLYEWLYKNYYSSKKMGGNLTTRIKIISNKPCYYYIMKECFNNMDVLQLNKITKTILNDECIQFIKILHSVSSSLTGTFLDYLVRRIICEITQNPFHDRRASRLIDKDNDIIHNLDTEEDSHVCSRGCNYRIEQSIFYSIPECFPECKFDKCVNLCYEKITNTEMYSSVDIMEEIFISSLSHSIEFGGCPNQSNVNEILNLIKHTTNIEEIFYLPLRQLCLNLLKENPNVLLNPALGHQLELLDNKNILADCDLVINNYLYDIKCTSDKKSVYEILQLLGYASLLNCNSKFNNNKVDNISIINLLQGYIVNYDISYITKDQMVNYLRVLTK